MKVAGRKTLITALSSLAVMTLLLSGCTSTEKVETEAGNPMPENIAAELTKVVKSAMELSDSSQALVGIWAPWTGDFVEGITTDGSELSGDSQFRAAQSSQAVVCAALLSLANDGEIELNRKLLKDMPRQVGIEGVTYGQLCEGTSGIADFKKGFKEVFANNPTRFWPERELIAAGVVDSPLSKPGAEFHASDTNAVLLGRGLSLALQRPLAEILEERVFGPRGMSETTFPLPKSLTVDGSSFAGTNFAMEKGAVLCDSPQKITEVSNSMLAGAGGSVSTMKDLKKFYVDYVNGAYESGSTKGIVTKSKAFTAATAEAPESLERWGFGLMNVGPLWGNAGEITGTISAAFHEPTSGYSVVVVLNNSAAGASFAKNLALKLTSVIAQEAEGGLGELPWKSADMTEALKAAAVCKS